MIDQAILRRPPVLIAVMCVAEVLAMTGFAAYWSLLPVLQAEWRMSNAQAGWLSGAFFGGYVLVVAFLTAMTDRVDARYVFILGAALSAAGLVGLAFLATGFWSALLWRVIAGTGLAGTYMPGLKVLTDRLPEARQVRAVAFYTSSFSIGTAVSYSLAGVALEWFGWRGALLFAAAGPILSLVAIAIVVTPRKPEAATEERGHVLDFRPVLRSRETMAYIMAYAGHGAELFAMRSWIVPFLVFCLGSGSGRELDATLLATAIALVAVVSSIGGAELALRIGRVRLLTWVMLATFAISVAVGFSSPLPFAAVVVLCLIYSAAIQADSAALTAGAVATSPVGHRGATLAVHSTLGFGGSLFAPALVGVVLDVAAPLGGTTAWGLAFLAMGSMALLGYVFFLLVRRRPAHGSTSG
ncbi:MAG: MFS transporter [Alphaproteobacteria bacterium]|nr:MFS transporter [Alphaproteobacteria bacterium]